VVAAQALKVKRDSRVTGATLALPARPVLPVLPVPPVLTVKPALPVKLAQRVLPVPMAPPEQPVLMVPLERTVAVELWASLPSSSPLWLLLLRADP
jgi:hypothetical protein